MPTPNSFGVVKARPQPVRRLSYQTWLIAGVLAVFSLFVGWLLAGGHSLDLRVPLSYAQDGLLIDSIIQRVMENSWINVATRMGAPFGSLMYDYPIPDSGSLLALKLIGDITGSSGIAFNVYYLLGFPLNALSAYFALRRMEASPTFAFAGATVFTLLPFHTMRVGHLFYTWYFVAPIFTVYAYRIFTGDLDIFAGKQWLGRFADCLTLLALSCFGVYYALFGVVMMATAGVVGYLQTQSRRAFATACVACAIVCAGVVINVAPNLNYRLHHTENADTAHRMPAEAELYGLKLVQMVLPRPAHRSNALAELNSAYSSTFPLVNENATSSLGFIGVIGLVMQLVVLFGRRRDASARDKAIYIMSALALILFLVCTVGGISALFNLLATPMIRAWNRASVFMGFLSIAVFMLVIQRESMRRSTGRLVEGGIAVLLVAFAFWDQTTSPCPSCLKSAQASYTSDDEFVHSIEQSLPKGSAIYQLPYFPFPENIYTPLKGYLHSKSLQWSYGGIRGRDGDIFYKTLAARPVPQQITVARNMGFAGVLLDLEDYPDHGTAIVGEFTQQLGKAPSFVSSNGSAAYFDLRQPGKALAPFPSGQSSSQIMNQAGFLVDALGDRYEATLAEGIDFARQGAPTFLSGIEGVSSPEAWGRWTDANLSRNATISFKQALPARFALHIIARGFGPNAGVPSVVTVGGQQVSFVPSQTDKEYVLQFNNVADATTISIAPPVPVTPHSILGGDDNRAIGIGLVRLFLTGTGETK